MHHVDFTKEDVDVAVRDGNGRWLGLDAVRLSAEEHLFAVCSPRVLGGHGRKFSASDLLKIPLLHLDDRGTWSARFEAADVAGAKPRHGPTFNRASMLPDAAVDGQGIALARTTLAKIETFRAWLMAEAAADRRQVEALDEWARLHGGYRFCGAVDDGAVRQGCAKAH